MLNKFTMLLVAFGILLNACTYFDFDDESDYAPSVRDVVGCWLSTENLPGPKPPAPAT